MMKLSIKPLVFLIIFSISAIFSSLPVLAGETAWSTSKEAKMRVVTGGKEQAGGPLWLGLEFSAAPGWKLYWRTPGDAGFPPTLTWNKQQNIKKTEIFWPAPVRHIESTEGLVLESFVYHDRLILPLSVMVENPSQPVEAELDVQYAACREICIPLSASATFTIQPGEKDAAKLADIQHYLAKTPTENHTGGLGITGVRYLVKDKEQYIEVTAESESGFSEHPDVFIESGVDFQFRQPEVHKEGNKAVFLAKAVPLVEGTHLAPKDTLRLTLVDGGRSVEDTVENLKIQPFSPLPVQKSWLVILGFALLGGLILNIMPCVLPVLSIKVLSVLKHGGRDKKYVRFSFLASAAGIIASFLCLGVITVLLKAGGENVGWGFHFQDPPFLIALVLILVLFASNLAGRFEFNLPGWLGDSILKLSPHHHSLVGDFMTGVLATVLATPCTAPFVGTAVSFALSRGMLEIMLVFAVMGTGLALPYLLFSFAPGLATKLPKPGKWMQRVKYVMAILLTLTAFWILWVLSDVLSWQAAVTVFLSALLVKFFFERHGKLLKHAVVWMPFLALSLFIAFTVPLKVAHHQKQHHEMVSRIWQPFDEGKIPSLVASGKVVFVDITADWCITCKFNKTFVLDREDVMAQFRTQGVVAMRGDITTPDKEIMDYMQRHGRYGIPFNMAYGPGAPEGIPLSELLTVKDVVAALKQASGKENKAN